MIFMVAQLQIANLYSPPIVQIIRNDRYSNVCCEIADQAQAWFQVHGRRRGLRGRGGETERDKKKHNEDTIV